MPKKKLENKRREADLKKVLLAIEEQQKRERTAFRKSVDSLRNSPPVLRAEGCLRFWAERLAEWGDHEAVIYLASRGNDCASITRTILANWRQAEVDAISRAHAEWGSSINENPTKFLSRFWGFFDSQELSIDATM